MLKRLHALVWVMVCGVILSGCTASKNRESLNIDELFAGQFHFDVAHLDNLKDKQAPKILVVGCSDSRVDPALLTGSLPGDIFVVRNIANLIPPYDVEKISNGGTGAALEYAVNVLKVEHIVILGHSNCGGIKALMSRKPSKPSGEFIDPWLDLAEELKKSIISENSHISKHDLLRKTEIASMEKSAENLLTYPWIKERVDEDKLKIHTWYFDIDNCKLSSFPEK